CAFLREGAPSLNSTRRSSCTLSASRSLRGRLLAQSDHSCRSPTDDRRHRPLRLPLSRARVEDPFFVGTASCAASGYVDAPLRKSTFRPEEVRNAGPSRDQTANL